MVRDKETETRRRAALDRGVRPKDLLALESEARSGSDGPTLSEMAAKAVTSADHEAVVKRFDAEIDHEQGVLNTLDRKREQKAMQGTSALREHVHAMRVQHEVIEALEDARAKAVERLEAERKREATAALEVEVERTLTEHIPAERAAEDRLRLAFKETVAADAAFTQCAEPIDLVLWSAERAGRTDLIDRLKQARRGGELAVAMPSRLTEELHQGPNEPKADFDLRVNSQGAGRIDWAFKHDARRSAARAARTVAEKHELAGLDRITALRIREAENLRAETTRGFPGSGDPIEKSVNERAYKEQRHRDPANLANEARPEPRGGTSTYNRYEFGGL